MSHTTWRFAASAGLEDDDDDDDVFRIMLLRRVGADGIYLCA